MKITELIKFPIKFDTSGSHFFDADGNMIAQVRGWGRLQYEKDGAKSQDFIGLWMEKVLNEALERETGNQSMDYLTESEQERFEILLHCEEMETLIPCEEQELNDLRAIQAKREADYILANKNSTLEF